MIIKFSDGVIIKEEHLKINSYHKKNGKKNYAELAKFYKNHGHSNGNYSRKTALGSWVFIQRQRYKKGSLNQEEIDLLKTLQFDFHPHETLWKNAFNDLTDFYEAHGHSTVESNLDSVSKTLLLWCRTQRQKYRKGTLTQEKIDLLDRVDFKWKLK